MTDASVPTGKEIQERLAQMGLYDTPLGRYDGEIAFDPDIALGMKIQTWAHDRGLMLGAMDGRPSPLLVKLYGAYLAARDEN